MSFGRDGQLYTSIYDKRDDLNFQTDQNGHLFYAVDTEVDLNESRVVSMEHFATGLACQQGTLILPDTWFRLFYGLAYAPFVETSFL